MRLTRSRQYRYHLAGKSTGPREFAVYLGNHYPGVYLTRRETQCCLLLLQGLTMLSIADELQLSNRTVEYYISNIKEKLACSRRQDLIAALLQSDFLQNCQPYLH